MDKISRAEASKRGGQASCPSSTTNLRSTTTSISLGRSAPRAGASDAPAAVAQRATPPTELRPRAVRRSLSSAEQSRAHPHREAE
jgi:hypothetical protein